MEINECNEYREKNQITYYDDNNFEFKDFSKDGASKFYRFIFRSEERDKFSKKFNKMRTSKITNEDLELFKKYYCTNIETYYTFYPFLYFGNFLIKNWVAGCSCSLKLIDMQYSSVAEEYKNYYKDNNCKTHHFISENEENELVNYFNHELLTKRDFMSELLDSLDSSPNKKAKYN